MKHSRDVHGPRQKCPYCEFTYAISRKDNLRRLIRIKHFSDSATRSTMDSRVVIDTSSQGVTENTELGSQSQLTEQIDEGPLDLSIKVTNQSPPRKTQTIAACTEDTSKIPQFETTSQGSSPRPEVRSAVSVIKTTDYQEIHEGLLYHIRQQKGCTIFPKVFSISFFKVSTNTVLICFFQAKVKVTT